MSLLGVKKSDVGMPVMRDVLSIILTLALLSPGGILNNASVLPLFLSFRDSSALWKKLLAYVINNWSLGEYERAVFAIGDIVAMWEGASKADSTSYEEEEV